MKILELELKNWGPHAHVHYHLNSSVIGVMAPNGSGKSNLLEAVKFALTGTAEENLKTYVRQSGDEDSQAKEAMVRMVFEKNGMKGTISRFIRLSGNGKRELIWDGSSEPITDANGVDAKMAEIFNADKDTIKNAIFIAQGELDKLFYGSPSESEKTMSNLLGIAFIPKRAEYIRTREDAIKSTIKDLTGEQKYCEELKVNLLAERVRVTDELEKLKDIPEAFREVGELDAKESEWVNASSEFSKLRLEKEGLTHDNAPSVGELETWERELAKLKKKKETLLDQKRELQNKISARSSYLESVERITEAQEKRQKVSKSLEAVLPKANMPDAELAQYEAWKSIFPGWRVAEANVKQATQLVQGHVRSIQEFMKLHPEPTDDAAIEELEKSLNSAVQLESVLSNNYTLLQSLRGSEVTQCPTCGSTSLNAEYVDARLASTLSEWETAKSDVISKRRNLTERRTLASTKSQQAAKYQEAQKALIEARRALDDIKLPKLTEQEVDDTLAEVRTAKSQKASLETEIRGYDQCISAYEGQKTRALQEFSEADLKDDSKPLLDDVQAQLAEIDTHIIDKDQQIKNGREAINKEATVNARYEAASLRFSKAEEARNAMQPRIEALAKWSSVEDQYTVRSLAEDLQRLYDLYLATKAEMESIERQEQAYHKRHTDLLTQLEKDSEKRGVISDYEALRNALCRTGIPSEYMSDCFRQLIDRTNENLSMMNTPFLLQADPTQTCRFLFQRTDMEDAPWLPQEKLSGGQKVRLTIAFLLAIHALVIPDVGLLVLDEPSCHLDEDSISALRELIAHLNEVMRTRGVTIIMCDHSETLKTAFVETIVLKKPNTVKED